MLWTWQRIWRERRSSAAGAQFVVWGAALVWGGLLICCGESEVVAPVLPSPDRGQFAATVYPVLLRDCAFHACHGDPLRPFQVFGPGRRRLPGPEGELTFPVDAAWPREVEASYERARSMLLHRGDLEMAPLLRKIRPGGAHEGVDHWGRNVYRTTDDEGYQAILNWARGLHTESEADDA